MEKEAENIIQDIILTELGLPTDYGKSASGLIIPSVYIVAPNINLGTTDKLQIGIQSIGSKIISNHVYSEYVESSTGGEPVLKQNNEALINDFIQIDLLSRNSDARLRRHEVFMALNSIYAQQQQETYLFKIFNLPQGFHNTSRAEGGTTILRYSISFTVQYLRTYSHEIITNDYYNSFPNYVDIEEEATVFNFTIPST